MLASTFRASRLVRHAVPAASFSARRSFASKAFFDVAIDGEKRDRLEFKLYDDVVPKTTKNFAELCTGEHGFGYKNSKFHRIIPEFMAQGGDFTSGDGRGGKSIYGAKFADENFEKRHTKRGLLSMANAGRNTNGSQFFITFRETPHLDGNHVVFGELVSGEATLKAIEEAGSYSGKPLQEVEIVDSGVIEEE